MDGDSDQDVIFTSQYGSSVAWYENDGNGSFGTQEIVITDINGAPGIRLDDLDKDGDVDVVTAWRYRATISWF